MESVPVTIEVIPFMYLVEVLNFFIGIFAAILAVQLYSLLKTGEVGKTWKLLVFASLVFAFHQLIGIGERFQLLPTDFGLFYISEFIFVVLMSYAFYLQRKAFFIPQQYRQKYYESQRRNLPRSRWLRRPGERSGITDTDEGAD